MKLSDAIKLLATRDVSKREDAVEVIDAFRQAQGYITGFTRHELVMRGCPRDLLKTIEVRKTKKRWL